MTQRDSKDLADALAALAAGHHEEPEPGTEEHDHPAVPMQEIPQKPAPAAQRPVPAAKIPAAPRPTPPVAPAKPAVAPPPKKPAPQIPEPKIIDASANFADAVAHLSEEDPAELEEAIADSEVIAPAPTLDAFIPHYRTAPAAKTKDPLESRRTLIPILLTSGVILLLIAMARFVMGSDSVMADIVPMWGAGVLLAAGAISLGMAAMNMVYVKNALARRGK